MGRLLSTYRFLAGVSRMGLDELQDFVLQPGANPARDDEGHSWARPARVHVLEDRRVLAVSVVPDVTSVTANEGQAVQIAAELQGGTAGTQYTVSIDWGDGSPNGSSTVTADADGKADLSFSHTYGDDGEFTQGNGNPVVLSVAADTAEVDVTINNVAPSIALSGNNSVNEGTSYTLNLGAVSDPGSDTVTQYRIHWGDGNSTALINGHPTGQTATHTYADDGSYTITVDLVDEDGTHLSAGTKAVTVNNVAPTITVSGNNSVNEGTSYTLTLGTVVDPGADGVTSYRVNWGDGSFTDFNGDPSGKTATHTYTDDGAYTITVDLTDADGTYTGVASKGVTVNNVSPTIALTGANSVNEAATYTLTLGAVTDPGTDTVTQYRINWGDGTSTGFLAGHPTGEVLTHVYGDNGSYTITVDLIDEDGTHTSAGTKVVTVNNVAPTIESIAVVGFPGTTVNIVDGDEVTLEVTFFDPGLADFTDGQTLTAVINWGDGSPLQSVVITAVAGQPGRYTFSATHTYNLTLPLVAEQHQIRVAINDGTTTTNSTPITVNVSTNNRPVVTITPAGPIASQEGQSVEITISYVDDGPKRQHDVVINWGDGSPNSVFTVNGNIETFIRSHTYADNGNYTITVSVTDRGGQTGTQTATVNVSNVAPTIPLNGATTLNEGATYTLTLGNVVDPGTDTVTHYRINWGDGTSTALIAGSPNGVVATHVYADNGSYTITVDLVDEDGTHVGGSKAITVNNVAPTITLTGNATVNEGAAYTLNLGAVVDPGADTVTGYIIDWGDGTSSGLISGHPTGQMPTHVYANDGTYTIRVTLVDEDGNHSNAGSLVVTVNNVAPVIDPGSIVLPPVNEGQQGSLTFDFVDPGLNDTYLILVDWGDGNGFVNVTGSSTVTSDGAGRRTVMVSSPLPYAQDGNYAVQIRVVDAADAGSAGTANTTIQVNDVAPQINPATIVLPAIDEGQRAQLTFQYFDPGLLDTHRIVIDWGDGNGPVDVTALGVLTTDGTGNWTFTVTSPLVYRQDGVVPVQITVHDAANPGAADAEAVSLQVRDVAPVVVPGSVTLPVINEGQAAQLTFDVFDPGLDDRIDVTVDFGNGPVNVTAQGVVIAPGTVRYTLTTPVFLQDGDFTLQIAPSDSTPGAVPAVPVQQILTVRNVAPVVNVNSVTPTIINEGESITLQVQFSDPGLQDFSTATPLNVTIDWGDGTQTVHAVTLTQVSPGVYSFTVTRVYADDVPTGSPVDVSSITFTFMDDDVAAVNTLPVPQVTVQNLPPVVTSSLNPITVDSLGIVTLTMQFKDPGVLDVLNVVSIDWGGAGIESGRTLVDLGGGVYQLTVTYQYTVDPPSPPPGSPNPVPHFVVQVTVQDDDTGQLVASIDANVPSGIARVQPETPTLPPSLNIPQSLPQSLPTETITNIPPSVETSSPSSAQSAVEDSTVQIVLREVLPSGRETLLGTFGENELDGVLAKLRGLPDRRYRVYMIMPDGSERLIVDVVVRQGRLSDPASDANQYQQDGAGDRQNSPQTGTGSEETAPAMVESAAEQGAQPDGAATSEDGRGVEPNSDRGPDSQRSSSTVPQTLRGAVPPPASGRVPVASGPRLSK